MNFKHKLRSLSPYISEALASTITVIGITTVLFIALNIAALIALDKPPEQILQPETSVIDVVITPTSDRGQAILTQAMGEAAAKRIKESYLALPTPYFAMHPNLHYIMTNVNDPYMHIGVEGVRYLPGWTDEDVRERLHGRNRPLVLLLGGSTTLGHGLRDDETIAAYLQQSVGEKADVLNLGAGAYDEVREINRLEYLLRQGIRPQAAIFLDGLNDIFNLARSNYRWNDKIIYHGLVAGRGDIGKPDNAFSASVRASVRPKDFGVMLSQAIPASRYLLEKARPVMKVDDVKSELDPFIDIPFNYAQAEYVFSHWGWYGEKNLEPLKRQAAKLFKNNLAYISGLSGAFNFKALVFYQPNGMVDPNNAFNGENSKDLPGYKYLHEMDAMMRAEIKASHLPMVDLADSLDELSAKNLAYIDAQHYSPAANKHIADLYRDALVQGGVLERE
jgi:hypothetical protein